MRPCSGRPPWSSSMNSAFESDPERSPGSAIKQVQMLSIVVPAFAQERSIRQDLKRLSAVAAQIAADHEIILVIDGVVDKTEERARELGDSRVKVEVLARNGGKGLAVRHGLGLCRGEVVGFIDAGMDIDEAAVPMAVQLLASADAHLAVGSKRHSDSHVRYPLQRRVYSWGYQLLCRLLFDVNVTDTQVGVKFMRADVAAAVVPDLTVDGFAFDIELLALAHRRGLDRIVESPVTILPAPTSSIGAGTVVQMLRDTMKVFFQMRVRRVYDGPKTVTRTERSD